MFTKYNKIFNTNDIFFIINVFLFCAHYIRVRIDASLWLGWQLVEFYLLNDDVGRPSSGRSGRCEPE